MIERAIHAIYDAKSAVTYPKLTALNAFVTGTVLNDPPLPYANINLESEQNLYRSNTSRTDRPLVRIKLWDADHNRGNLTKKEFVTLFENTTFENSELLVQSIRKENSFAIQEPDGVWQFVIDFEIKYQDK